MLCSDRKKFLASITDKTPTELIDGDVQSSDQDRERMEKGFISLSNSAIDTREIGKKGFEAARDFWTQQLGGHTLTSAQETFGKGRLEQIN